MKIRGRGTELYHRERQRERETERVYKAERLQRRRKAFVKRDVSEEMYRTAMWLRRMEERSTGEEGVQNLIRTDAGRQVNAIVPRYSRTRPTRPELFPEKMTGRPLHRIPIRMRFQRKF